MFLWRNQKNINTFLVVNKKFAEWLSHDSDRAKCRLNIVQPSMKSKSRSVIVYGTGQGASWQMFVRSFIRLETSAKYTDLTLLMPVRTPLPGSDFYVASVCQSSHNKKHLILSYV